MPCLPQAKKLEVVLSWWTKPRYRYKNSKGKTITPKRLADCRSYAKANGYIGIKIMIV